MLQTNNFRHLLGYIIGLEQVRKFFQDIFSSTKQIGGI